LDGHILLDAPELLLMKMNPNNCGVSIVRHSSHSKMPNVNRGRMVIYVRVMLIPTGGHLVDILVLANPIMHRIR
jgi:hypothetical protein